MKRFEESFYKTECRMLLCNLSHANVAFLYPLKTISGGMEKEYWRKVGLVIISKQLFDINKCTVHGYTRNTLTKINLNEIKTTL